MLDRCRSISLYLITTLIKDSCHILIRKYLMWVFLFFLLSLIRQLRLIRNRISDTTDTCWCFDVINCSSIIHFGSIQL